MTIPKRVPPPLPARSPARTLRASKSEFGGDVSMISSPLRQSYQSALAEPAAGEATTLASPTAHHEELTMKLDDISTEDGSSRTSKPHRSSAAGGQTVVGSATNRATSRDMRARRAKGTRCRNWRSTRKGSVHS